jgi:hypothetical protein
MERTKSNKKAGPKVFNLHTFASEIMGRRLLAGQMGMQYDGARDVYQALGYPLKIQFDDYLGKYLRHDIAKAVIDRPVNATWQGELELIESDDVEQTPFEKAWRDLNWKLDIKGTLARVDRLTGIGTYGVLLLGLDDVSSTEGFKNPVRAGARKLVYLKPFSEKTAKILTYVDNPKNSRYGKPLIYELQVSDTASGANQTVQVHYSRIVHIVDNSLESEIVGCPRLEPIYNRLMDLEKIVGGDAEMFWRGARPGFQGIVDKDYTLTPEAEKAFQDQIDEYENYLRRILLNEGITMKELAQTIADPKPHVDVQLTCVSAVTGIPKRVLSGSERGELASTQDTSEWKTYVQSRREDHATPRIIRPLVDTLIKYGVLPAPEDEYSVDWEDLFAISEKERVEIGKVRASALREYTYNPLEVMIVPPKGFLQEFLGFSREQINQMESMQEDDVLSEIKEMLAPPEPAAGSGTGTVTRTKAPVKKARTITRSKAPVRKAA